MSIYEVLMALTLHFRAPGIHIAVPLRSAVQSYAHSNPIYLRLSVFNQGVHTLDMAAAASAPMDGIVNVCRCGASVY